MHNVNGSFGYQLATRRRVGARTVVFTMAAAVLVTGPPAYAAEDAPGHKAAADSGIVTDAVEEQSARCSRRYHAKLGSKVLPKARATLTTADAMRRAISDMPGYWLFWDGNGILARNAYQQRLLANQRINIVENRMCVRSILARGGRIRCLKWKPVPVGYKPPPPALPTVDPSKPQVSLAERRIAAALSARVGGKGAFRELEHGTAFYHMAQRTTDELIAYASQPHRDAICAGAHELIGFYRRQLEPLSRKASAARQLLSETRKAALATIRLAHPRKTLATSSSEPDLAELTRGLLVPVLKQEEYSTLTSIEDPLIILTRAREILSDQRIDAMAKKVRDPLQKALRNIEFAIYAKYNARRMHQFFQTFESTFQVIQDVHSSECTCHQP